MLLIIDLQHIYYRCWYTRDRQTPIIAKNGRNISHVKATFDECIKIISDLEFHYDVDDAAICICLDSNGDDLLKKEKYPEYKANRQHRLDETNKAEIKYVAEALGRLGATVYDRQGYEADDLVYSLVLDNKDVEKVVYTSDADLLMHVDDMTDVWIRRDANYIRVKSKRYVQQVTAMNSKKHKKAIINDMVLYKSCVGDTSDNIKGIHGYGEKAYEKKMDVIIEACPNITVASDYASTLEFAKKHMGFTEKQFEQFEYALGIVFPYYCEDLLAPNVVSLAPFLHKSALK